MGHPGGVKLTSRQSMDVAMVSGRSRRLTAGDMQDMPLAAAVEQIHAITRDPVVLGVVLASARAHLEVDGWSGYQATVELLRAAGADEQVAQAKLDWLLANLPEYRGSVRD